MVSKENSPVQKAQQVQKRHDRYQMPVELPPHGALLGLGPCRVENIARGPVAGGLFGLVVVELRLLRRHGFLYRPEEKREVQAGTKSREFDVLCN